MDYEQKYKEALDWMRSVYPTMTGANKEDAEHFFPELKESEDERIIKELTSLFKDGIKGINHRYTGEDCERWVAWLERQGEQKPIDKIQFGKRYKCIASPRYSAFMSGEIYKPEDKFICSLMNFCSDCFEPIEEDDQKHTDKVEHKFKVGDWVIGRATSNEPRQISEITDQCYKSTYGGQYGFSFEEDMHLWTIQDAKDGDVLIFEGFYNSIVLFQGIGINGEGRINYHCKCDLGNYSFDVQGDVACLGTVERDAEHYHPATKEQRDLLFQKMKEAGYEWDSENRELMKIDHKELTDFQERLRGILIESNGKYDDNTVIRLSGQVLELVEQKPVEWDKDDITRINEIIETLNIVQENRVRTQRMYYSKATIDKNIDWLKSLKDKYTWKPSEEQILALAKASETYCDRDKNTLYSLYNDLKKLREE